MNAEPCNYMAPSPCDDMITLPNTGGDRNSWFFTLYGKDITVVAMPDWEIHAGNEMPPCLGFKIQQCSIWFDGETCLALVHYSITFNSQEKLVAIGDAILEDLLGQNSVPCSSIASTRYRCALSLHFDGYEYSILNFCTVELLNCWM